MKITDVFNQKTHISVCICACVCLLFGSLPTQAQIPLLHNYTTDNAPAFETCFEIFQDKEGLIYFGARDGLFIYDGTVWEEILSVKSTARAIAQDEHGTVFVGTHNDLGYLEVLPNGKRLFISLSEQLTAEEKTLPTIWDIVATKEGGVWARSQRFVYHFKKQGNQYKKLKSIPAYGDVVLSFEVEDLFCTTEATEEDAKVKLFIFRQGEKKEIVADEKLIDVHAILPFKKDEWILISRTDGFLILDLASKKIRAWDTHPQQELVKNAYVYEFCTLKNGGFALATTTGGVLIFSKEVEFLYQISEKQGLQSDITHVVYEDVQGNLWVGVGQGVSKIALGLPFLLYDKYTNIKDYVYGVLEHEGVLYLATNSGVFYAENGKFNLIEGTVSQCWNLFAYQKGIMVGGGNSGAFYIENKKLVTSLAPPNSVMQLVVSKRDSSIFYVTTYSGLRIYKFENRQFTDLGLIKATETDCRSAVELPDGRVWIGTTSKGAYLVSFPAGFSTAEAVGKAITKHYKEGFKDIERNRVFENKKGVFFTSKTGLYQFNADKERFELYNLPINYDLPRYQSPSFKQDQAGNLWFLNARTILRKGTDDTYTVDTLSLLPISKNISGFFENVGKQQIYLSNADGVYVYDTKKTGATKEIQTKIRAISFSVNDSLVNFQEKINLRIPYTLNGLLFKFSCLNFLEEKDNEFQYKLDNYDTHWSAWTKLPQKEYTNLREGTYTFRVKARNAYKQYTKEATYTFTILPPWYRTWYAYILYVLASVLGVWGIVIANTKRLQAQKKRLEHIVKERTVELEQQKEEITTIAENLKQANEEVSTKNKNITASINYARRIQQAILPFDERISQTFKEYFIFYQPRDIVSGDFYFFEDKGDKVIVVCADCTGHGVPGAFMSMIGNALLLEIINKEEITSPDRILQELHKGIRYSLKQQETQNHDGMDIGILVLDREAQNFSFAGAMNSLLYFKNQELHLIKGTKLLIGGSIREQERVFNKETVKLDAQEATSITFYMQSDGYHDQFGGEAGKKYTTPRLKELLTSLQHHDMSTQKKAIQQAFEDWKGNLPQTDDVLLIGIKINLPFQ